MCCAAEHGGVQQLRAFEPLQHLEYAQRVERMAKVPLGGEIECKEKREIQLYWLKNWRTRRQTTLY